MNLRSWPVGSVAANAPGLRVDVVQYAGSERIGWHRHEQPSLFVVLSGSVREQTASRCWTAQPLWLAIKPADVVHRDDFGPTPTRALRIVLDAAYFSGDERPGGDAFEQWVWLNDPSLVRQLIRAASGLAGGGSASAVEDGIIDVVAALPSADPGDSSGCRRQPRWLQRARERLDEEMKPPRLSALARDAGVHPVHFAARFRHAFGRSVGAYIRWRRLTTAVSRLAGSDESLSVVAQHAGFADHPHLARAFRSEFGVQPRSLRRVVRPL
jgi:AraC family transcriptional regulator